MHPTDSIATHFRLTKEQRAALSRLALHTLHDLLYHFPVRHEKPGATGTAATLIHGEKVTLYGRFTKIAPKKLWKSRRSAAEGTFEDGSGRVKVLWFNQPYIAKMVPPGVSVKLTGTVSGKDRPYITNPEVELLSASAIPESLFSEGEEARPLLFPVYPETKGITSRWFFHAVQKLFEARVHELLHDPIPPPVRATYHLPAVEHALVYLHTPQKPEDAEAAKKRFAFEEIFTLQVGKQLERARNSVERPFTVKVDRTHVQKFLASLPFRFTDAQARALEDILTDFEKGRPMARLVEGDVGSGKTAVAAAAAYAVVHSRPKGRASGTLQAAYMAPTEILATQHFASFIAMYRDLPFSIGLLTGSVCMKFPSKLSREKPTRISRAQLLRWVAQGEIALLIGTHALVQKSVSFSHLAFAIVDEQHRFGTRQRKALARKGDAAPHFLSMTATPIPRTLALTIYGDLDISVIDELPKDRAGITTRIVLKEERAEAYRIVGDELQKGRQAYVVCPRIDEPDPEKELALVAKSVLAETARLKRDVFPEYTIGTLHGKMPPHEKERVMKAFAAGEIHVLVATSVVEVGVNVPNATCIMIEGAERFGLSQLHQLRGRVLRSSHAAFCFLLPETRGHTSLTRLRALEKTRSGFELAEADLALRGAGDLLGRSQWGISDIGMEALKNPRLISAAREAAARVVAEDPKLSRFPALRERIEKSVAAVHEE